MKRSHRIKQLARKTRIQLLVLGTVLVASIALADYLVRERKGRKESIEGCGRVVSTYLSHNMGAIYRGTSSHPAVAYEVQGRRCEAQISQTEWEGIKVGQHHYISGVLEPGRCLVVTVGDPC